MNNSTMTIDTDGDKIWRNADGQLHRDNGPAMEYMAGDKFWYINGDLHRTDGPAIECANGDRYWYINGQCHREDGPALECADGDRYWFIDGEKLTEKEFDAYRLTIA